RQARGSKPCNADVAAFELRGVREHADAEVRDLRPYVAVFGAIHQNVRRLDIFVQYAHTVRSGNGVGHTANDIQPKRQGNIADAAVRFSPFSEIAKLAVFAFQVVRRVFEMHFIQPRDVGAVAQSFPQQSHQREFPPERTQSLRIKAELEHTAFA